METPTDTEVPRGLTCVGDMCQYPRTCQWNDCCMEAQMKKSLEAKRMAESVDGKAESRSS